MSALALCGRMRLRADDPFGPCGWGTAWATERVERRLAAILAADVAGCSWPMGADEEGTLARLKAHRCELIDLRIAWATSSESAGMTENVRSGRGIEDALGVETGANATGRRFLVHGQMVPQKLRETLDTIPRHVDNKNSRS